MATNEHPASLLSLQSSVSGVGSSILTLEDTISGIPGGSAGGYTGGVSTSNSSTLILLKAFAQAGYLTVNHFNDSESSGSTLYIYMGADSSYPLYMKCTLAGGACGVPLPNYVYSENGWSLYVQNDGTNYSHVGWSFYSAWGALTNTFIDPYDTWLASNAANTNYGNQNTITLFHNSTYNRTVLVKFDLSSIPATAIVKNAIFSFVPQYVSGYPDIWSIAGCLRDWDHLQATWNIYKTGSAWAAAGGQAYPDCEASPVWTGVPSIVLGERYGCIITSLVQRWVDGSLPNNGLTMWQGQHDSDFNCNLYSRQTSSSANYPRLQVDYTGT